MDVIKPADPQERPDHTPAAEPQGNVPSVAKMRLGEYLGINAPSEQQDKMMDEMVRVLDGDAHDPIDFLWQLKQLENRIGTPPLGVTRMQHLYNFVKLNAQMSNIRKEMEIYGA